MNIIPNISNISNIPNVPKFLEPNHYFSSKSAEEIISTINDCLKNAENVDFTFKESTFVCLVYVHHASIELWINLYRNENNEYNKYIIEFQRRSGDAYSFCEVVRSIKAFLQVHSVISLPSSSFSSSSLWNAKAKEKASSILSSSKHLSHLSSPSLPPLPPLKVTTESIQACVRHMLSMVSQGYTDVRISALHTLANMSTEKEVVDIIESEEHLQTLLSCLSDETTDVHRLATTILANVCMTSSTSRSFVRKNGIHILIDRSSSSVRRVTIESLRALKFAFEDASDEEKEQMRQTLSNHLDDQDERVQKWLKWL